jgi:hypothetical protein
MAGHRRFWTFLNTGLGRLLVGFVLTTSAGSLLMTRYQERHFEQQRILDAARQDAQLERDLRLEMLRRLDRSEETIDQIGGLANARAYKLRQAYCAILTRDLNRIETVWNDYMSATEAWNTGLIVNRGKLVRSVSDKSAERLFRRHYSDPGFEFEQAGDLHSQFMALHRVISALRDCARSPECKIDCAHLPHVNRELNAIEMSVNHFIGEASKEFLSLRQDEFSGVGERQHDPLYRRAAAR